MNHGHYYYYYYDHHDHHDHDHRRRRRRRRRYYLYVARRRQTYVCRSVQAVLFIQAQTYPAFLYLQSCIQGCRYFVTNLELSRCKELLKEEG